MAPTRARAAEIPFSSVSPKSSISPEVGTVWAVSMRMIVVLPAPLRPTRP